MNSSACTLKLGKTDARVGAIKFNMMSYLNPAKLPRIPDSFGHEKLVKAPWGMLANDEYGCCVWAGAAHETMLWNAEAGRHVTFTANDVLSDYATTGFQIGDPSTDNGTDMETAAKYRRTVGIRDSIAARHKIAAYLAFDASDIHQLKIATYFFSACGIGLQMPSTAMDQFKAGGEWLFVHGAPIEGGHYVPCVAFVDGVWQVVTWGKTQPASQKFIARQTDEAIAYVSREMLINGKSLEGFGFNELEQDLKALG